MSPYIVTTKRPAHGDSECAFCKHLSVRSRLVVATLGKARDRTYNIVAAHFAYGKPLQDALDLPESGGTVGPLPDETVIKVTADNSWQDLAHMAGLTYAAEIGARAQAGDEKCQREILDAFNARHYVSAA